MADSSGSSQSLTGSETTGYIPVNALSTRTQTAVMAQDNAHAALEQMTGKLIVEGRHRWLASADEQNLMLMWWFVEILGIYLQAVYAAARNDDGDAIRADVARQLPTWFELIDQWQLAATRAQANLELGNSLNTTGKVGLPIFNVTPETAAAVWSGWNSVCDHVAKQFEDIKALGVPVRLRPLLTTITNGMVPPLKEIELLDKEWMLTPQETARQQQLAESRQSTGREIFELAQLMYAPIVSKSYPDLLSRKLALSELVETINFDPWCLTDPQALDQHKANPTSQQQLAGLWEANPSPSATFALAQEVQMAHEQRKIRRRFGKAYPSCPWVSQWLVHSPVIIGGVSLSTGQLFAIYVGKGPDGFVSKVAKAGQLTSIGDLLGQ